MRSGWMGAALVATALVAGGPGSAFAQAEQPAKASTGGGGASSGGGIRHFSATGLGMAVGRAQGGGATARHGFLVGSRNRSDLIPPEIEVPEDLVQSTDRDQCRGTVPMPAIVVNDDRDRDPQVTVTILGDPAIDVAPTGEDIELDIGSYDVLIVAEDRAGNRSQATFRVDVVDQAPPIFVEAPNPTPAGQPIEATSPAGTPVNFNGTCRDACDPNPQLTYEPNLFRFPVGETGVTARCTDRNDNTIESAFVVRIEDTTPPELAGDLENVQVECESPDGTTIDVPRVLFSDAGTATDDLGLALVINPGQPDERALAPIPERVTLDRGRHVLRYTATDSGNNVTTADLVVDIIDNGVPQMRVVRAPEGGWSNGVGPVSVVLEVTDGCSPADAPLDVDIAPAPASIDRDGNRVTLNYQGEGLYELEISVTDEDGNTTRDNSVAFGIDNSPPQAIIRVPSQLGVDADDALSYPIFARADRLPIDFGGEDGGDGQTSGVRSVEVFFDPDGNPRELARERYDGDGNPARGQRLVAGIGCEELLGRDIGGGQRQADRYCGEDTVFDIRYLEPGVHTVEVVVTDFAGNVGRGRGYFVTADLHSGAERIISDLGALLPQLNAPAIGPTRAALTALARARDASDARIDDTPFDSSVFLGSALRAAQTATLQLLAAADVAVNDQGQADALRDATDLLQRVSRSDVVLLAAHIDERPAPMRPGFKTEAEILDLRFYDGFLDQVDEDLDNEAYNAAIANVQSAYFHAKSALEGWVMDYHRVPDQAAPLEIRQQYTYANEVLTSMTDEMGRYLNEGLAGGNEVRDIRAAMVDVSDALDTLIEFGFDEGGGLGLSDQRYVEELISLRAVANQTKLAGNNGVWVRNYQWSMMQVVRFMVHASIEDAILERGMGRRGWPIYETGLAMIDGGVQELDDRRIQTVIDRYGVEEDSICLLIASYHCDFLDDEENDQDEPIPEANVPEFCWDRMWRPREWAMTNNIGVIPPQCQYGEQVER